MTLEDFFTLTEMKDGLTALTRVQELITVMQNQKDCAENNIGEASRQWIAVASTIAATEDKDCLALFITLNGLRLIDRWLKDAQKFCNDSNESFLEESITTLLRAIEVLHVDRQRSISSGIWITVENLLAHKSSTVQDRARLLFDGWKQEKDDAAVNCEAQTVDGSSKKRVSEDSGPSVSGTPCQETVEKETQASELSCAETKLPLNSDIQSKNNQLSSDNDLDTSDVKERAENDLASAQENLSTKENPSMKEDSGTKIIDSCKSAVEEQPDGLKEKDSSKTETEDDKMESSVSSPSASKAVESDADPQNNCKASETNTPASDSKEINTCNTTEDGECCSNVLQGSSVNDGTPENQGDLEKNASKIDKLGAVDEDDEEEGSDEDRDFRNAYEFSKPVMDTKRSTAIAKRAGVDLDYGVDALEVARRVAKAVEREVGDHKGLCSSSSEQNSEDGQRQPNSPDSVNERGDLEHSKILTTAKSESADQEKASEKPDIDSQRAQKTENVEKGFSGFDLNEEVCSDEMDHLLNNNVSTPISIVSASRPATTPGLPVAPLKFEGSLGWKGSAATSAFRPASPRRNSEDKNPSLDSSLKQRQDWLDFDLNVTEAGEDVGKQIPRPSGLPSGVSYVEVMSPKRTERFKLDLNTTDDDDDILVLNSREQNRNGHRSPSPASSSSSMQPFMRNFDLNDRPFNEPIYQKPSQAVNPFIVPKSDSSVISLMGTRVEINKKDFAPHVLSLSNGKSIQPAIDASTMTRTGNFLGLAPSVHYGHSHIFGYNGLSAPPAMSLSPAMYGPGGPIPCIMDSRSMAMPQIVPSVPPYSQPPFIMSLNGAGPSRPNFDLNSGFMVDGGNRDLGLRQFLIPGQGRPPPEEHYSQPPSSSGGVSGKRKEPDSGWEAFQFSSYKHHQHQ